MNAEDYLIDIKKEIYALNRSIRMILFCMRREHLQFYKEIEPNYKDDFTYESIIYNDIC